MSARDIPEPRLPNPKRQFSQNVDHGPLLLKHTFEHAELNDGAESGEQGEELLREETELRTDDEGRPKQSQPSPPR